MRVLTGLALAAALFGTGCRDAVSVGRRVDDGADILPDAAEQRIETRLSDLEAHTRHQMIVVTVATLGGRDIAAYARDLGNRRGIGRKGHDDGVVLLVAPGERKVRIAVGDGLATVLDNKTVQAIIDDRILPPFRKGDMAGGVVAGTEAVVARLQAAP